MDVAKAASNTLTLFYKRARQENSNLSEFKPERHPEGVGVVHQLWCLTQVAQGEVQEEKAHRWLGWAQGYLAAGGHLTLEEAKFANVLS